MGRNDFSDQFRTKLLRVKRIDYNLNVMQQSVCLFLTQSRLITVRPSLIARRWVGRKTLLCSRLKAFHFSLVVSVFCRQLLGPSRFSWWFSLTQIFSGID